MSRGSFEALHPSSFSIFVLAFCWALLCGLLLQLIVLPALPNLHAGHGLLKGGDWIRFHSQAVLLALQMAQDGWGVWELRPQGNAPIGMAAAVYFLVGIYEPWLFLPINAFLFGMAAFVLYNIFKIISSARYSFLAVLPFVFFPSAVIIYGQIHKDIFSVLGILLVIFVWMDLARRTAFTWPEMLAQISLMVAGGLLVWLVRSYLLLPLLMAGLFAALLLTGWVGRVRRASWWCALAICLTIQLVSVVVVMFFVPSVLSVPSVPSVPSASVFAKVISRLNVTRVGFLTGGANAGSNIDMEVQFASIEDVLLYLPRALQIGLLAPFPSTWFDDAVSTGGRAMRVLAGMEMTLSYVFLLGWVGFWRCGKERGVTLFVGLGISLVLTLILTLVVLNVGTLYRMRYATWQLLNGLGILGWGFWCQARSKEKNDRTR